MSTVSIRAPAISSARQTWDPTGKFANTHLTQLFGLTGTP
jgi:hypothetical protein